MATRYPNNLPAGSPGFGNSNNGRVPLPPVGAPVTTTTTPLPKVGSSGGSSGSSSSGSGGGSSSAAKAVGLNNTDLQSGEHFANLFGHIFGYDNIYRVLQDASNEKFNSLDAQARQTRDRYLGDMAAQQQGIIDNSRNIRQQAVRTGLSKGSNVASEVMQQMAAQQQGMGVQQEYRGVLNDISNQRASQQGADIFNAMNMQNELASQMGNFAVTDRANSVQELASRLGFNAQVDSNNATRDAARMSADAMRYGANSNERIAAQQLQASMGYFNALKAQGYSDVDAWRIATSPEGEKVMKDIESAKNPKPSFWDNIGNFFLGGGSNNGRTPTLDVPAKNNNSGTRHPMGGGTYAFPPKK